MSLIALVVVAIIIIAVLPTWPYSAGWGYGPTGALTFVLVVLLVLMLLGHL